MREASKVVAILGCGWLGIPLAEQLLENGYEVKGSTTTPEKLETLRLKGIDPHLIRIQADEIMGDFVSFTSGVEVLVIDFPPGIRNQPASEYNRSIELLVQRIRSSSVKKVVFVSSISVYEDTGEFPVYTEEDQPNASSSRGKGLIGAEEIFRSENGFSSTILRLGGLIGEDRNPINQLSGRKEVANPEAPTNLISQLDCVGIIVEILLQGKFGEVFNAVYPEHPEKQSYYLQKARERELIPPEFNRGVSKGKIIDSSRITKVLDYQFKGGL